MSNRRDPTKYQQNAVFTMSDGQKYVFTGPGYFWPDDERTMRVEFTKPQLLPEEERWVISESIPETQETHAPTDEETLRSAIQKKFKEGVP